MQICNFPGARPIGKPRDWDESLDGPCGCIYVSDQVDTLTGQNIMYSIYKPTEADLVALNAGGALRLGIMGRSHPVFQMCVLGPRLVEDIDARAVSDLGEPIDYPG